MSDTQTRPGSMDDFAPPASDADQVPIPHQTEPPVDNSDDAPETQQRWSLKNNLAVTVVTVGLSAIFIPPTMALVLGYSRYLLVLPVLVVLVLLAGYALVRSSLKLDEDSTIQPSQGVWVYLNALVSLGGRTGARLLYILPADYRKQVQERLNHEQQQDLDDYETLLTEEIKAVNQGSSFVVTTCNVKGGAGKSPLAALIAIFLGLITRGVVTAIDFNPYKGNLHTWIGITPGAIRVRELFNRVKGGEVTGFKQFREGLGSNDFNNQLVPSNPSAQRDTLSADLTKTVLNAAVNNSDIVVCDTSNDIGAAAFDRIVDGTDAIVLAGLCKADKLDGVQGTLDNFREWDWHNKVRHSVIVLMGLEPGQTVDDYRQKLQLDDEAIVAAMPFDVSLSKFQAIKPQNLSQEARIAALEVQFIISRVAQHTQQVGGWNKPALQFTLGQLVPVPSGRTPVLSYVDQPLIAA